MNEWQDINAVIKVLDKTLKVQLKFSFTDAKFVILNLLFHVRNFSSHVKLLIAILIFNFNLSIICDKLEHGTMNCQGGFIKINLY